MINNKIITVVLPAYNASKTLEKTYLEIPFDIVDNIILVDDFSQDDTVEVAQRLGLKNIIVHDKNKGYGANQKTCYNKALELNSDIVIMLHPDYQYTPKLIPAISYLVSSELTDVVFCSRILGKGALKGGMPFYKYIANRFLTFTQNLLMNQKMSEYHTGYRAFAKKALMSVNFNSNSDNFIFDNEMAAQLLYNNFSIYEISCPTKYFKEASSINFKRSMVYGFGVLRVSFSYFFQKLKIFKFKIFE